MPACTSLKYRARSPARCDGDGLCDRETRATPRTARAMTANTHRGVRLVAQPERRGSALGGSVCAGEVMPRSPFRHGAYGTEFIRLTPLASSALVTAP